MTLAKNKRLIGISITAILILLIPFVAMLFTDEVKWTVADFLIVGVLLLGTGVAIELIV